MSAKKHLLARITPAAPRHRCIDWPFAIEGDEAPRVAVRVLSGDELDRIDIRVAAHFRPEPRKKGEPAPFVVSPLTDAYENRKRAEVVFASFSEPNDKGEPTQTPIAASVEDIAAQPPQVRDLLYVEWAAVQSEVAPPKFNAKDLEELIEYLKKKSPSEVLGGFPSSLLIALITTLVGQLASSTTANGSG
jgi:hypothetical protein